VIRTLLASSLLAIGPAKSGKELIMAYGKKTSGKKMASKAKKEFTPCSRCPDPSSCKRAGMCLAQAMS
jgi:hypothetical protein